MINRVVYGIGTFIRNKEIYKSYRFLKTSEKWNIRKLESYQIKKCKELLQWAYDHSTFYKKKFDEAGMKPKDFNRIEDLEKFPFLTKEELLNNAKEIQIKENFSKLFYSETSGSTGQPLIFYRNGEWDARHRSAMFRGYSWYDIKPWDKNGYFWGYNIDKKVQLKIKFLDFLQNRFRIFSYDPKELISFVNKLQKAKYLEGYSSMIYEVARIINQKKMKAPFKLKMIKGTSEKILEKYKEEIKQAFGVSIISEYGAAEAGIIAFECPMGNMHITMENVIVEEIDNEIVVTNLMSKSFPIIRYKLGDYIKLDKDTKCSCGKEHYIIKEVLGRVGNVVYGFTKNYPSLTLYYVFKNLASKNIVLNYQVIQREKGKLEMSIEQKLTSNEWDLLENELCKYFKEDVQCIIVDNKKIPREKGKFKDFISLLK